jgi:hypothetical protein
MIMCIYLLDSSHHTFAFNISKWPVPVVVLLAAAIPSPARAVIPGMIHILLDDLHPNTDSAS